MQWKKHINRLLILTGMTFIWMASGGLYHGVKSLAWTSVTGEITQFKTLVSENDSTVNIEKFEYTYQVQGKIHTGDRIRFGTDFTDVPVNSL